MTNVEKEFMREHKRFVQLRMKHVSEEVMRSWYPKNELIGHTMLMEECFYFLDDRSIERSLFYVNAFYPGTTKEDMMNVYNASKDFIYGIYG